MQLTIINNYGKLNIPGVYKFSTPESDSFYIGSSNNIGLRLANHKSQALNGKHFNIHFERWFNKYQDNIIFEVLCTCPVEYLQKMEQHCIDTFNPNINKNKEVTNVACAGWSKGLNLSEQHRESISKSLKDNPKVLNNLTNIRPDKKGIKLSKEHIENIKKSAKRGSNSPVFKLNEETVKQIKLLLNSKSNVEIASMFNISRQLINQIRKGITWKHI